MKKTGLLLGTLLLCAGTGAVGISYAQDNDLSLLDTLEHGMWQFHGSNLPAISKLCVGDPMRLTQIQHGDANCTRYIVKSTPTLLTISYICRGQGQGMTTIRKETNRLVQIQSQGVSNNAPFAFSVEARRIAGC